MNRKQRRQQQTLGRRGGIPGQGPAVAAFARAGAAFQAGRLGDAEALLRETLRYDPNHADAHHWLGVVLGQKGDSRLALEHLRKAAALKPASADFLNNLGIVQLNLCEFDAAQKSFERAVKLNPRLAAAHHNLGLVFKERRDWDRAIACFERAIELVPNYMNAHLNLGNALSHGGKREAAIAQLQRLIEMAPDSKEAYYNLAAELRDAKRFDQAVTAARKAIELDPNCAEAHNVLGSVYTTLGRFDEARKSFETALAIRPDYAEAIFNFSVATKDFSTPETAERIETLLRSGPPQDQAAGLHFALGKVQADLGKYDAAFEHYRAGNNLSVPDALFDAKIWTEYVDRMIAVFTPEFFAARQGFGDSSRRPVFIVGMPRSGTTLTEQIIAAHPKVAPGDELETVANIANALPERLRSEARFPECAVAIDAETARDLAHEYLAELDAISPDAARVTDKMPMNYQNLGLIALMFPAATYIHCRRDPIDTCLSCYFQRFGRHLDFSYSLENLAAYYRGYRRLMAHWRRVLPVKMLEVDYEQTVADQEGVSRRLIAHCGLEWDDACLQFYSTDRAVQTASVWQVRQPIYKTSVERWRRYERHLGPLIAALEDVEFA